MTTDPLLLAVDIERASTAFLATVATLDDAAVAAPSRLPGWTRGHVLTHVARNADGAVNLLTWARTGVETPQYASWEQRVQDIEAGSARPLAEQLADLRSAVDRFAAAIDEMPPAAWSVTVRWTTGATAPAARVPWSRLREVELHHVDLDAGYTPQDWPEPFAIRMARTIAHDYGARADTPRLVIRSPEVGHDLGIGVGLPPDGVPVVSGRASSVVAWLTGRADGTGLTVDPAGPLPPVPPFG